MQELPQDRAVLVGLVTAGDSRLSVEENLEELALLARSAGAEVVATGIQARERPHPAYLIGEGKAREVRDAARMLGANLVIFDRNLSPAQQHNLEDVIGIRVINRTQLILDIFALGARTNEGKLQVELAQLSYLLPRLIGRGEELSRLGGGIGTRGPGETKLEMDRRRIRGRITELKRALKEVRRTRQLHRDRREKIGLSTITLVGYTNAGKSTLFNRLTGADVEVKDQLFATLDPTIRRTELPNGRTVLLSDTVGFIRNLPHQLVAAFHSTLEGVKYADALLIVADASGENRLEKLDQVYETLAELDVEDVPRLIVWNKCDLLGEQELLRLKRRWPDSAVVSALTGSGLVELKKRIAAVCPGRTEILEMVVPFSESSLVSALHEHTKVLLEEYLPQGVKITAEVDELFAKRYDLSRFATSS